MNKPDMANAAPAIIAVSIRGIRISPRITDHVFLLVSPSKVRFYLKDSGISTDPNLKSRTEQHYNNRHKMKKHETLRILV